MKAGDMGTAGNEILTDQRGPVRIITLNRPERLNAMNSSLVTSFREALAAAHEDSGVPPGRTARRRDRADVSSLPPQQVEVKQP
jgi:hypothetical protein